MKITQVAKSIAIAILCITIAASVYACGVGQANEPDPTPTPQPTATPTPPPATPEPTPTPVVLVPYEGVVEHIFFHEVIAFPEVAFSAVVRQDYDPEMVTAHEFLNILESLYNNDFILVDLNEVWTEFTNENGQLRMVRNTLMLPEGKKPIVISFDDLSFYEYMHGNGFMRRYIIGDDGDIWAEGYDPNGDHIVSQDLTVITILDKFVRENPGFSHNGAKGCIALTGYEGVLGYRTQNDPENNTEAFRLNRMQEVARARPVVERLKETGWYFASHSYGHIRIATMSLERVQADAERWMDEVGSIVGETKIFIYPFGERLDGADQGVPGPAFRFYVDLGFRFFASVGREPFTQIKAEVPAVIMDRMLVGGRTLRNSRDRYIRLFDAAEVFDPMRPEGDVNWD